MSAGASSIDMGSPSSTQEIAFSACDSRHDIFGFAFAVVVPKQQCAAWIVDKLCALVALQTQTS
jgi:hypothetical protein